MDSQELKKLREAIVKEVAVLEAELSRFANKNPDIEGDYKAHFHKSDQSDTLDEKAHSVTDYEEERAVEQNLELRLKSCRETLKKIDEGAYGNCQNCKAVIDQKRLEAIPATRFCLDCAKKASLL